MNVWQDLQAPRDVIFPSQFGTVKLHSIFDRRLAIPLSSTYPSSRSTYLSKRRWSRSLRIFDPYSFKNSITILNFFYLQLNHTSSSLLKVKIMASPHITKTENIMICLILLRRKTNRNGSGLTPPNPGSCKSQTGYSMTSQLNLRQLNTYIRQYILLYLCFAAFATPTLICTCRNIFSWFAERKFELLWKDFRHIFQATWLNERNFSFLQRTDNYKSLLSLSQSGLLVFVWPVST